MVPSEDVLIELLMERIERARELDGYSRGAAFVSAMRASVRSAAREIREACQLLDLVRLGRELCRANGYPEPPPPEVTMGNHRRKLSARSAVYFVWNGGIIV